MTPGRRRHSGLVLLAVALSLVMGCGDDIQFVDPPQGAATGGEALGPHAGGGPHAGMRAPDPHGAKDGSGSDPFVDPEDASAKVGGSGGSANTNAIPPEHLWYGGKILPDPGVKLPSSYTLFVSAGYPPKGRPPVLSRRYPNPTLPLEFELRQEHQAFGNARMDGPLVLYVTLSESGSIPMGPPPPGFGEYWKSPPSAPLAPETRGVELLLKPQP